MLEIDHIGFVRKVRQKLRSATNYPENVQEFIRGLEESININSGLTKLLGICKVNDWFYIVPVIRNVQLFADYFTELTRC